MNQNTAIGIDLAKRVFQVCIIDTRNQQVQVNKALKRYELLDFIRQQPRCRVFMEACGGSHYWARQIKAIGHDVGLISPHNLSRRSAKATKRMLTMRWRLSKQAYGPTYVSCLPRQ